MTNTKPQILLIHGFTGSTEDFRPLAQTLNEQGYAAQVVRLPGHDTAVADLNATQWQEWTKTSEDAVAQLDPDRSIVVIALSMGALLATLLAANHPTRITGLVLLAPAFALRLPGRIGVCLARLGLYHLRPFIPKTKGPNIRDPKAREVSKAYREIPVRALLQFEALRKLAIPQIRQVACPVFVGMGAHDATVDNKASAEHLKSLNSTRVEWHTYENSAHIVSVDYDHKELYRDILKFIENL